MNRKILQFNKFALPGNILSIAMYKLDILYFFAVILNFVCQFYVARDKRFHETAKSEPEIFSVLQNIFYFICSRISPTLIPVYFLNTL